MATKKTEKVSSDGKVKARVLVDGPFGKVNDVVEFASEQEAAAAGSDVDPHPEAVAYAESLK